MTVKALDKMLALPSSLSVASCRPLFSYIRYYKRLYFYQFIERLLLAVVYVISDNQLAPKQSGYMQ